MTTRAGLQGHANRAVPRAAAPPAPAHHHCARRSAHHSTSRAWHQASAAAGADGLASDRSWQRTSGAAPVGPATTRSVRHQAENRAPATGRPGHVAEWSPNQAARCVAGRPHPASLWPSPASAVPDQARRSRCRSSTGGPSGHCADRSTAGRHRAAPTGEPRFGWQDRGHQPHRHLLPATPPWAPGAGRPNYCHRRHLP